METGLRQRVAIILAASKGFGKATALALAGEGCKIAICSREKEQLTTTAEEIGKKTGSEIITGQADVEHKEQIEAFIQHVLKTWHKVDILVTNAGGPPVKGFEETVDAEWEKYFRITFMSVVWAVKAVLPAMKAQRWGRIINITSISVKEPIVNLIYSNALRPAVVGLAKTLSKEVGPYGITVHNIAPGYHRTDGLERIVKKRMEQGEQRADIIARWEQNIPLRRIGEASELGALITFLCSEQAGYMTGNTIQIDGGQVNGIM
jgi:3-oxoacyl-[acyl-carrier protein] reductase